MLDLCTCLRCDQICRLPGVAEHLEQAPRLFLQQLSPVLEVSGMVLELAADLQAVADQDGGKLCHQFLCAAVQASLNRKALAHYDAFWSIQRGSNTTAAAFP